MSQRQRNKDDKLRRITEAARTLFRERGFSGTTTRAIAERAQVGAGTLFLYAPTKEDLLVQWFAEEIGVVLAGSFARDVRGDLVSRVHAVFSDLLEFYQRDPELARLFVRELGFLGGTAAPVREAIERDFVARLAGWVQDSKSRGEVSQEVPELLVASNFFALYLFSVLLWFQGILPDSDAAKTYLRNSLELHMTGLLPRKGSESGPQKGTS